MNRNPEFSLSSKDELSQRLERHPTVRARVERMLDLIEKAGGDLKQADDAERRAITDFGADNAFGQVAEKSWLNITASRCRREPPR